MSYQSLKSYMVYKEDAPEGFYAVHKSNGDLNGRFVNCCNRCDARELCSVNLDGWCKKNPCMSYDRRDGQSVVFKKK